MDSWLFYRVSYLVGCNGRRSLCFVKEIMNIPVIFVLRFMLSFIPVPALGQSEIDGSFHIGCIKSCTYDASALLDINFVSVRLKCKCFCDTISKLIDNSELTQKELDKFNRDGTFSEKLQEKKVVAFNQCFVDTPLKK